MEVDTKFKEEMCCRAKQRKYYLISLSGISGCLGGKYCNGPSLWYMDICLSKSVSCLMLTLTLVVYPASLWGLWEINHSKLRHRRVVL